MKEQESSARSVGVSLFHHGRNPVPVCSARSVYSDNAPFSYDVQLALWMLGSVTVETIPVIILELK